MINTNKLFELLDKDPNLTRLHNLEKVLDKNEDIKELIAKKQNISKQLMNARALRLTNAVNEFKAEYETVNQQLMDYPFISEYFDLLDYYNDLLKNMISYLEFKINNGLK